MSRDEAMGVTAKVIAERGRWEVYLGVDFWLTQHLDHDHPVETVWHRIADFPSEAAACIAARLYERVADRYPPVRLSQEHQRDDH